MNLLILLFAAALLLVGTVLILSLHLRRFSFRILIPPLILTAVSVLLLIIPCPITFSGAALLLLYPSASLILLSDGKKGSSNGIIPYLPALSSFAVYLDPSGKWTALIPSFFILFSRLIPALRLLRNVPESDPGIDFYRFSLFYSRDIEELSWLFFLLLSLSGGGAVAFTLSFLLDIYLIFHLSYGSPFFFSPALDGKIHMATKNSQEVSSGRVDSEESGRLLYIRCRKYMEEKRPFLVESFCLRDLASALATNTGYLSRVINRETGLNFRRFVNGYRVKYSMDLFRRSPGIPVTELASLSGFATSSTYYTAFQQLCHESPGSWCRRERRRLLGCE